MPATNRIEETIANGSSTSGSDSDCGDASHYAYCELTVTVTSTVRASRDGASRKCPYVYRTGSCHRYRRYDRSISIRLPDGWAPGYDTYVHEAWIVADVDVVDVVCRSYRPGSRIKHPGDC